MSALDPAADLSGAALDAWLDYRRQHREQRHSPRTIQLAGETLAQLQRHLDGHHPGATILTAQRRQVSDYLIWCGEPPRKPSTQLARHRVLRAFYRFCVAEDILAESPVQNVKAPEPDYKVPEVLADDQLIALLAACRAGRPATAWDKFAAARDEAMIRLLCEWGTPRASELASLRLADVDLEQETVTILDGKGGISRVISVSPLTARALSRYKRARALRPGAAETDVFWLGLKGPVTRFGVGQIIRARGRAAGVGPVHPHQLRHTAFADMDSQTGGHVNAAMALFGWRSPVMAQYYGRSVRGQRAVELSRAAARGNRLR